MTATTQIAPARPRGDDDGRSGPLAAAVLGAAGLDATAYRTAPLVRRLPACLRTLRTDSETAATARLAAQPSLLGPTLSTLLIGTSEFFRDADVFAVLRARVVTALPVHRGARILSVGCSSGAELYSVALLLAEARRLDEATLFGLDCRADAVAAGRSGQFADAAMTGVPVPLRFKYFTPGPAGWQARADLRRQTTWVSGDATREVPPGPWDVILCRNLAIYLRTAAAGRLFSRLAAELAPGGHLVVGKAERPPAGLPLVAIARSVYRRHAD